MIYFVNNSGYQQIRISHTGLESDGEGVLSLSSTLTGNALVEWEVDVTADEHYHTFKVALPDTSIPVGEYYWRLEQDGELVASGLACVGEYTEMTAAGSGVESINIKQYGE